MKKRIAVRLGPAHTRKLEKIARQSGEPLATTAALQLQKTLDGDTFQVAHAAPPDGDYEAEFGSIRARIDMLEKVMLEQFSAASEQERQRLHAILQEIRRASGGGQK